MKKGRIILWSMLLLLIFGSVFAVIYVKNKFETKLTSVIDIQESNHDIRWEKIRSFKANDKRGIRIVSLSAINIKTGDSLFYAKEIVFFTEEKLSEIKNPAQISIFIDSPTIHLHETETSQSDAEMPEESASLSFQDMPSLYIHNLSIVNYNTDTIPQRIQGINMQAVQKQKAWQIDIRYKANNQNILTSAQLRGNMSNFKIDSAFISTQNIKICNFEYEHTHFKRADDNYRLHIYNQLIATENERFNQLNDSSYLDFDYLVSSQNGDKKITGYSNAYINIPDSLNVNFSHTTNQNPISKASQAHLDFASLDGFINWDYSIKENESELNFSQHFTSELKTELQIAQNTLELKSVGDFQSISNQHGQMQSRGNFYTNFQTVYDDIDYLLNISGAENRSILSLQSIALNLNAEINLLDIQKSLRFKQGIKMDGDIHLTSIELPDEKQKKRPNRNFSAENKEFKVPNQLKEADIKLDLIIDSLIQDNEIIALENTLSGQYQNENVHITSSMKLSNQFQGYLKTNIELSNGKLNGSLFSDGLQINNTKSLPLISSNIEFTKDTANIYAFKIPFQSKENELIVQKSILRSDEFLLMLSGTMTTDNQQLKLGLSAPSGQFKGAAALLINAKASKQTSGLQTLILKVNRKNGKFKINTEVLEN
jgi:hypothetical protein